MALTRRANDLRRSRRHVHLHTLLKLIPRHFLRRIPGFVSCERVSAESRIIGIENRQELRCLGLEHPDSTEFLKHYERQPDVVFAKGCGALGADYILVIRRW